MIYSVSVAIEQTTDDQRIVATLFMLPTTTFTMVKVQFARKPVNLLASWKLLCSSSRKAGDVCATRASKESSLDDEKTTDRPVLAC
jgi:hypothetical protein